MAAMVFMSIGGSAWLVIPLRSISLKDKKHFTSGNFFYTVCINSGYIYSYLFSSTDRREDAGLFLGVVEAPAH